MFEKFDHKFKGKKSYNFFITFIGLLFASFLIFPDNWKSMIPFLVTMFTSFLIAKFSADIIDQSKKSNKNL